MKKSYNSLKKRPFIELDNNEVKIIRKALKICDEGDKFARKIYEGLNCDEFYKQGDEFYEQGEDFRSAKMYLSFVLCGGSLYYWKKRKKGMENYSRYMRTVHKSKEEPKKEEQNLLS